MAIISVVFAEVFMAINGGRGLIGPYITAAPTAALPIGNTLLSLPVDVRVYRSYTKHNHKLYLITYVYVFINMAPTSAPPPPPPSPSAAPCSVCRSM